MDSTPNGYSALFDHLAHLSREELAIEGMKHLTISNYIYSLLISKPLPPAVTQPVHAEETNAATIEALKIASKARARRRDFLASQPGFAVNGVLVKQ